MTKRFLTIVILLPALAGSPASSGTPELGQLMSQEFNINEVPEKKPATLPVTTTNPEARNYFRQALHKQWNFDAQGAIELYRQALKLDPEFVRAHLQLGLLGIEKNKWHKVRVEANLYLLPENERLFVETLLQFDLDPDALKTLAKIYPNDPEVFLYLGESLSQQGRFPAARDAYLTAIRNYPASAFAWQSLGNQYLALKDYYRALMVFEKEKSLIANRPQAYLALGRFYLKTWKYEKAMQMAGDVIRIAPDDWQGYVLMANALTLHGDSKRAQEILQSGIEKTSDPDKKIEFQIAMVDSLIDDGEFPQAIKHLSELYRETSKEANRSPISRRQNRGGDIYFLNRLGDTYLEYGDYGSAQDVYDNVLRICEGSGNDQNLAEIENTYLFNTARVALIRKDFGKANQLIASLSRIESYNKDPSVPQKIARLKGEVQLASGNPAQAILFLKKTNLKNPYLLNLLATAYMQAGNTALAHKYFKKAIEYSSFDKYEYAFVRRKARAALRQAEPVVVDRE